MRHLLVSAILAIGLTPALSAQTTPAQPRFGITGGLTVAKVGGSDVNDAKLKTGFVGGGVAVFPISPTFSFQPELVYAMKGSKFTDQGTDASFKLNYVELPVLVRYDVPVTGGTKPFLLAGPAFALETTCKISGTDQGTTVTFGCQDFFNQVGANTDTKSFDVGAMFGGGLAFDVNGRVMTVGIRYNIGFMKVFSDTDVKNRVLSFVGSLEWPSHR
jgi:opacity protein-like surface antigen